MVLMKLKQISEAYIGSEVKDAVVTVPAYFNQAQRQATMDAGEIAGINVLRIINEPTAAAIAYGHENSRIFAKKRNVLVFDLGGGTFDVSVLEIENSNFQVKATAGDAHLGGEDFDNRIVKHCIKEFEKKHGKDMSENPRAVRRLRTACERAKRILSFSSETRIEIDALFKAIDYSDVLTQSKFVELNIDLFNKCIEIVEKCLRDAQLNKDAVDDVVLIGGSSRIPKVQQLLQGLFRGKELRRSIHQDEAVAYGAAVQAAFLSGHGNEKVQNLVLMEVTPLSLGVKTMGNVMKVLIPRNTIIPIRKVRKFATSYDNQTALHFDVLEGERAISTDNQLLGELRLTGLRMAPKGEIKVEICFDLQASGILNASLRDIITGKEAGITVTSGKLPREEIKMMIEEAERYKQDDQKYIDKNKAKHAFRDHVFRLRDDVKRKKQKILNDEYAIKAAIRRLDAHPDELAEVDEYGKMKEELTNLLK